MDFRKRERAMRLLLAAFLSSDLPIEDLRILALELSEDRSIWFDFNMLLQETLGRLSSTVPRKQEPRVRDTSDVADLAYAVVQRRRLSKRDLLDMMRGVLPITGGKRLHAEALSVRELLSVFLSSASKVEVEEFLRRLGLGDDQDEYLKGITRNR